MFSFHTCTCMCVCISMWILINKVVCALKTARRVLLLYRLNNWVWSVVSSDLSFALAEEAQHALCLDSVCDLKPFSLSLFNHFLGAGASVCTDWMQKVCLSHPSASPALSLQANEKHAVTKVQDFQCGILIAQWKYWTVALMVEGNGCGRWMKCSWS